MNLSSVRSFAAIGVIGTCLLMQGCSSEGSSGGGVPDNCVPAHEFSTIAPGKLTVSVYVSPPATLLDRPGGQLEGIDGAIIKEIAAAECLEVDAKPVDGAAFVSTITSNRADVGVGGIVASDERAKIMNLSHVAYRDGMSVLGGQSVGSLSDLQGKKIGAVQGYLWNDELTAAFGSDNVTVYQDVSSMLSDLKSGRIDYAIETTLGAGYRASSDSSLTASVFPQDPSVPTSEKQTDTVVVSTKDNSGLSAAIDGQIDQMLSTGRIGELLSEYGISPDQAGPAS